MGLILLNIYETSPIVSIGEAALLAHVSPEIGPPDVLEETHIF